MLARLSVLAALAAAPLALAQTFTDCNPLEKTCSPDSGLQASSFDSDFTQGASAAKGWTPATGTTLNYGSKGAEFTIAKQGQAPTLESDFHILFGTVEVTMQAAPGTGIVSSIVLESSDLDEIDWEFLGGDATQVESNYFGKGDTTTYDRAIYYPVSSPQTSVHTYKIDWSPDRIIFYIDGNQVRVINYADAKDGTRYPQTPMKVKLGNWAGGAPGSPAGTVEWAGGATDFNAAPFTMYVQSVKITNMYPAKEYVWGDHSGTWQSIKVVQGNDVTKAAKEDKTDSSSSSTKSSSDSKATKAPVVHAQGNSTKTESSSHTHTGNSTHAATAKPELHNGNQTTLHTTSTDKTEGAKPTAAVINAATSSAKSGNSTASAAAASQTKSSGASGSPAITGFILLFTLSMCLWMM